MRNIGDAGLWMIGMVFFFVFLSFMVVPHRLGEDAAKVVKAYNLEMSQP